MAAPESFTMRAISRICSRLSTAQGPAMTTMRGPPILIGADRDQGVLLPELPGGQLERLGDGDDPGHAGQQLHLPEVDGHDADGREHRLLLPLDLAQAEALVLQKGDQRPLVRGPDVPLQYEDHKTSTGARRPARARRKSSASLSRYSRMRAMWLRVV